MDKKTQTLSHKNINKTVGIITIQNIKNYGACLQSFALWYYINSLEYNCEIINLLTPAHKGYKKSKNFHTYEKKIGFIKRCYRNLRALANKIKEYYICFSEKNLLKNKNLNFERFNSQIKFSTLYKNADALYQNPPQYDIYITGSDQVWNPTLGFELEAYFLTFAPQNAKRIAYAPSIARNDLPPQFKSKYINWLKQYQHLSIREKSGQQIIESLLDLKIPVVLDPTFLLSPDEWEKQMSNINESGKFILCFTLSNNNLIEYAYQLSQEAQLPLVIISTYNLYKIKGAITILNAGPSELISYIYKAEMVLTDSFHGTALSIQLAKNFFSYKQKNKNNVPDISDRVQTIINLFNLNKHIITDYQKSYETLSRIQYDRYKLDKQIEVEREKSQNYLKHSLAF